MWLFMLAHVSLHGCACVRVYVRVAIQAWPVSTVL